MKLLTQSNIIQDGKISKILHKFKSVLKKNIQTFCSIFWRFYNFIFVRLVKRLFYEYIFFINQLSGFSVILDKLKRSK